MRGVIIIGGVGATSLLMALAVQEAAVFAEKLSGFRAPLPDRKVVSDKKSSKSKLVVKWNSAGREFIATHPNTNVTGSGESPGEAVRNWQYRWNFPY